MAATGTCNACGDTNHCFSTCKFKKYRCNKCGKLGHLAKVCVHNTKRHLNNHHVESDQLAVATSSSNDDNQYGVDEDNDSLRIFSMMEVKNKNKINKKSMVKKCDFVTERVNGLYTTTFAVNDVNITFEIDTGSAISAMPYSCFAEHFPGLKLKAFETSLRAYDGKTIATKGYFQATIVFKGKNFFVDFIVIDNGCRPLIGRDILRKLKFEFNLNINSVSLDNSCKGVISQFPNLFDGSLG